MWETRLATELHAGLSSLYMCREGEEMCTHEPEYNATSPLSNSKAVQQHNRVLYSLWEKRANANVSWNIVSMALIP